MPLGVDVKYLSTLKQVNLCAIEYYIIDLNISMYIGYFWVHKIRLDMQVSQQILTCYNNMLTKKNSWILHILKVKWPHLKICKIIDSTLSYVL